MGQQHDYDVVLVMPNGTRLSGTYQSLVKVMEVGDQQVHGRPLTDGGVPQLQLFMQSLTKAIGAASWEAYHAGQRIL